MKLQELGEALIIGRSDKTLLVSRLIAAKSSLMVAIQELGKTETSLRFMGKEDPEAKRLNRRIQKEAESLSQIATSISKLTQKIKKDETI